MQELASYLLKSLVDKPESVSVQAAEDGGVLRLKAVVAEEDKGKVIGREGKVIKAIRTVLAAGALKQNKKVFLDLD
ncbi:MAG: KH domain-containing protein [Elusimicrobiales bacterium]|nr:KH domain-containing protein [Elusimicrobiales bacterium]